MQVCGDWVLKTTASGGDVQAALTFYPSSQAHGDKSKQQDDAIAIGEVVEAPWLGHLLVELKQRSPKTPFLPLTLGQ